MYLKPPGGKRKRFAGTYLLDPDRRKNSSTFQPPSGLTVPSAAQLLAGAPRRGTAACFRDTRPRETPTNAAGKLGEKKVVALHVRSALYCFPHRISLSVPKDGSFFVSLGFVSLFAVGLSRHMLQRRWAPTHNKHPLRRLAGQLGTHHRQQSSPRVLSSWSTIYTTGTVQT